MSPFVRPRVHLYTLCWDEADMLGFFFRHYDPWVDRYVVFDDGSTDGSHDILAAHPKVDLRTFERSTPDSFCLSHQALQDEVWKESRGQADWVVITAIDEHLHVRGRPMADYLAEQTKRGATILPALGFDMNHPTMPADAGCLVDRVTRGRPRIGFNKLSIFDPDAVAETGFASGRHGADPVGDLRLPARNEVMLWHYKHLGFERNAEREALQAARLGTTDLKLDLAQHYRWSKEKLRVFWDQMERESTDLSAPDFEPDRQCIGPLWWSRRQDIDRVETRPEPTARKQPTISVLIKSFNHAPYVGQCIESVLSQSYQDFEIVVTDDASTDATPSILRQFEDPRIDLDIKTRNLGISGAMNATIARARGKYLAILNSDDWALPGRLESQVAFLEAHAHVGLVFGLPRIVGEDGTPTEAFNDFRQPLHLPDFSRRSWLRHFFFKENCVCAPTAMIRRKVFDGGLYDRRLTNLQDLDMWTRALLAGHGMHVLDQEVTAFRVRDNSANMSASRPDTRNRSSFEARQILRHFLSMTLADFETVFGADAYETIGRPVGERVALLALKDTRQSHKLFALETLYHHAAEDDSFDLLRLVTGTTQTETFEKPFVELESAYRALERHTKDIEGELQGLAAETERLRSLPHAETALPRLRFLARMLSWVRSDLRRPDTEFPSDAPQHHDVSGEAVRKSQGGELTPRETFAAEARQHLTEFLSSGSNLDFTCVNDPTVSVIVVIWNQAHLALRCFEALLAEKARLQQRQEDLELILIDNGSTDRSGELLDRLVGTVIVRNGGNEGFVKACNQGAAKARAAHLLLLNSDAFVRRDAIWAALETIRSSDRIGAVGGRLILPNREIQEAGSIVWSDGSSIGYARGDEEQSPRVMFQRDVDYCSGAFLLTSKKVWQDLGGFDEAFSPAYYEEVDYCMRLRDAGLRVIYEPRAAVDHFEFGSSEKSSDPTALQNRNRKRFCGKHAATLNADHYPCSDSNAFFARSRLPRGRRKLLVIDDEVPLMALGAGFPRAQKILMGALDLGWQVSVFPTRLYDPDWAQVRAEIPWDVEITRSGVHRLQEFLLSHANYFNVVMISRPHNMQHFLNAVEAAPHLLHGMRIVYDAEALYSTREIEEAKHFGRPLSQSDAEDLVSQEIALATHADAICCVSELEAAKFRQKAAASLYTLKHVVSCSCPGASFEARSGFLFVGRLLEPGSPNWEGLKWFIDQCWPTIRHEVPRATLKVIGRLHEDCDELKGEGVELVGPVQDLKSYYDGARAFVAPIRFAAGVPIKLIEASAAHLPSVGTRLMCRLLDWQGGKEILENDEAGAFAAAAISLHQDETLWNRVRASAHRRVMSEYSSPAFEAALRSALEAAPH